MQQQIIERGYEKANPEEIIFKLKAMIKILGGDYGRDELANPFNS